MDVDQTVDVSVANEKTAVDVPHAVSDALDRVIRRALDDDDARFEISKTDEINPTY